MSEHVFGGDWTTEKLERIRKYLHAYTVIFDKNEYAKKYSTFYVDAFAGTGERKDSRLPIFRETPLWDIEPDQDFLELQKGSARIALEVEPAFDHYLFIEHSKKRIPELERLRETFPARSASIEVKHGDANEVLRMWCRTVNWRKFRAVVFLDPYGMQVDWDTLEAIAKTRAIDLWILFPIGVAVNRLLINREPPPEAWANALTRTFGNADWRTRFYNKTFQPSLFGDYESERRVADLTEIKEYFIERLESVFAEVAKNPLILCNSRGAPLYLLCFAAGAINGSKTAVKIAQHLLGG